MAIKIITIGKTTDNYILNGLDIFTKRLIHYVKFSFVELPIKNSNNSNIEISRNLECETLLRNLKTTDFVILLDEQGKELRSVELALKIEKLLATRQGDLVFVIGGAYGFNDAVYKRANEKMSLSKLTFTHQMVRLIFIEQLYRAFTIIKNEKYHH